MALGTLYICYFGITEPLVQTQVLPYLRQLAKSGVLIHLLTFEPDVNSKWSEAELTQQRAALAADHISWIYLKYHKSPSLPATVYDTIAGAFFALRLVRRERISVLHARAHVPMAMALLAAKFRKLKLIFDIRGLMAEEYADAGIWKEGSLPFQLVKRIERAGIKRADQVVVLTERLRGWLVEQGLKRYDQIEVIPCCVDVDNVNEHGRSANRLGVSADHFEIIYAGSLVGLYLVEEMGRFFQAIKKRRANAFLQILSVSPPDSGAAALKRAGVNESDFDIRAVAPADVPIYLAKARVGVSFRKSSFAQIAASPTKIPEYLAAGLPVVTNAGIGDTDQLVERERVGVVVREFEDAAYERAADEVLRLVEDPETERRCREVARSQFDLQTVGGRRYVNIYRRLATDKV